MVDEAFVVEEVTVGIVETLDVGMTVLISVLFVVTNGIVNVAVSLPAIGVDVGIFANVERCAVALLSW